MFTEEITKALAGGDERESIVCLAPSMATDEETLASRRWKSFEKQIGDKWPLFTGDFECLNEVLAKKPSNSGWLLLQYLNSLCRSFGQVILANNPVSGLFIIIAIGIADYRALFAGLYASTVAFIFALVTKQDSNAILNGAYGFNPVLHGVVSVGALPGIYPQLADFEFPPKFWLFLAVTSAMSVYITSALNSMLAHMGRYPVPSFSLPFNLVQFILIYCLLNNTMPSHIVGHHLLTAPASIGNGSLVAAGPTYELINNTASAPANATSGAANCTTCQIPDHLNWGETFSGTIVAVAQVYGLNNVPCAALMYLALFIYSPIMTMFAYAGSLLGTIFGVLFAVSPEEIYTGVWGYNALLCSAAIAGFCFVLNVHSTLLALFSILLSTVLQHFLMPAFIQMNLPILSMPFNIATILLMFVTTESEKALIRPETITSPEKHREVFSSMNERPMQGYLRRSQIYEEKDDIV